MSSPWANVTPDSTYIAGLLEGAEAQRQQMPPREYSPARSSTSSLPWHEDRDEAMSDDDVALVDDDNHDDSESEGQNEENDPESFNYITDVESFLSGLPILSKDEEISDNECLICHEPMAYEYGTIRERAIRLPCKHVFGYNCIKHWLDGSKRNGTCPMCRSVLLEGLSSRWSIRIPNLLQDHSPDFEVTGAIAGPTAIQSIPHRASPRFQFAPRAPGTDIDMERSGTMAPTIAPRPRPGRLERHTAIEGYRHLPGLPPLSSTSRSEDNERDSITGEEENMPDSQPQATTPQGSPPRASIPPQESQPAPPPNLSSNTDPIARARQTLPDREVQLWYHLSSQNPRLPFLYFPPRDSSQALNIPSLLGSQFLPGPGFHRRYRTTGCATFAEQALFDELQRVGAFDGEVSEGNGFRRGRINADREVVNRGLWIGYREQGMSFWPGRGWGRG